MLLEISWSNCAVLCLICWKFWCWWWQMSNGDMYEKNHDEIDFEFLGNIRGKDWRIQTNIYGNGSTSIGREERYGLWFDPSEDFHQYSILWTESVIMWVFFDFESALLIAFTCIQETCREKVLDGVGMFESDWGSAIQLVVWLILWVVLDLHAFFIPFYCFSGVMVVVTSFSVSIQLLKIWFFYLWENAYVVYSFVFWFDHFFMLTYVPLLYWLCSV